MKLQFTNHIFFRTAILRKLFEIRFSYKHCNFARVCLLVKMASKTVTRSIQADENSGLEELLYYAGLRKVLRQKQFISIPCLRPEILPKTLTHFAQYTELSFKLTYTVKELVFFFQNKNRLARHNVDLLQPTFALFERLLIQKRPIFFGR